MKTDLRKPRGLATAIGSMPHTDPQTALQVVSANLPDIPVWPQLPHRSFLENMYVQYSEGFPGVMVQDERIWVDRSVDLSRQIESLYQAYLENDLDKYAIGQEYAAGLHEFLRQSVNPDFAIKGQVTGPISFGLVVTDQDRRPILYDETLADVVAKHLRLKAAWQERELARISPSTIMFIDEPYLTSLGSAYVALSDEMVITLINEVVEGIKGIKGIHCCGNTDWSVLLKTSIDILNFDAYNFGEALALYPAEIDAFLECGSVLAFGIIPNDEEHVSKETSTELVGRLEALLELLSSKGIRYDILCEQCLITPSCGLDSISEAAANRVLELTSEVSREFRRLHHFE